MREDENIFIDEYDEKMPMLALRGMTVFPNMLINFDVERNKSTAALNAATENDKRIFLLAQKDVAKEEPREDDLFKIGTVCYVKQVLRIPGGMKVLVEGLYRARLKEILGDRKYFFTRVSPLYDEPVKKTARIEALTRKCINLFDTYSAFSGNIPKEKVLTLLSASEPGKIADHIIQNIFVRYDKKQQVLETLKVPKRLEIVCDLLTREIEVLAIEKQINERLRSRLDEQHREHVLREQLRIIQSELNDGPSELSEIDEYREKIMRLRLSDDVRDKALKEVDKLEKQQFGSAEATVIRNYLDLFLELPWNKKTVEKIDVISAKKVLDRDHFGLEKVKERIIEFLAVKQLAPNVKSPIICLVGPPGVGKTSVAFSIAKAINRNMARLSLGGVHDEAEIRGHRKTYVGAMPGRIISSINQAKSSNPLILLDEIDKIGADHRGDPASALLEALDPEQNSTFRDHYLEVPFDLSEVMFITTANTVSTIPRALLDRMEIIELSSYTDMEKLQIAKRHLLSKQRKKHGLSAALLAVNDNAILEIISSYTKESGVRSLERELAALCRRTAAKIARGEIKSAKITPEKLEEYLGVRKFKPETLAKGDEVGLVQGLAWTSVGGTILEVEVNILPGTGKLNLTGNLGDVMKESAQAAVSYIRSRAEKLKIDPEFHKNKDIHIHFPEGAIPKDGPSAGITMAIAVISALTGAPVRRDVAMTGEISLRGRVMPIGGLKEKTMAAMRAGIKTVIIPADNESDLEEIDQTVRRTLNFIAVEDIDGALDIALDLSQLDCEDGKPFADHNIIDNGLPSSSAVITQ